MRYRNRVSCCWFMLSDHQPILTRVAIGLASGRIQADLHISRSRWDSYLAFRALVCRFRDSDRIHGGSVWGLAGSSLESWCCGQCSPVTGLSRIFRTC